MSKAEKRIRIILLCILEAFTVFTVILLIKYKGYSRLPLAIGTIFILLAPLLIEWIFKCKLILPLYIYTLLYAIGPMLGQTYNLYYLTNWWDKLLHISGGVLIAILGIYICKRLLKTHCNHLMLTAIFALCFSMAISMVWEFVEFSADMLLGTDMQDDSIVTEINSYSFGESLGEVGSLDDIGSVIVNGKVLPFEGYLDIGLIDTMADMLLETLGAVAAVLLYIIDKGKHTLITEKT